MEMYHYSSSIVITDIVGVDYDKPKAYLSRKEWEAFKKRMVDVLDGLKKLTPGVTLIDAINRTNKLCYIYSGVNPPAGKKGSVSVNKGADSVSRVYPLTSESLAAAMIKSCRPAQKNVSHVRKGSPAEKLKHQQNFEQYNEPNVTREKRLGLLEEMQKINQPTTLQATAPELIRVFDRARRKQSLTPRLTNIVFTKPETYIARMLNISENLIEEWKQGTVGIKDDHYYFMCCYLYDYLSPGSGSHTQVRIMQTSRLEEYFKPDLEEEGAKFWNKSGLLSKLDMVMVAHELIHAWRCMSGRRLVSEGWEEEAMTSGVGPFVGWNLTENTFRAALKLTPRKSYKCSGISSDAFGFMLQAQNTNKIISRQF